MLKEISVKNFKSFNQEQTFSMEADTSNVHEHPEHLMNVNGSKILKVSSLYGPNGGGKSNLLKAIKLASYLVGMTVSNSDIQFKYMDAFPFAACAFSKNDIVSESLFFINKDFEIEYSFDVRLKRKDLPLMRPESTLGLEDFIDFDIIAEKVAFREKQKKHFVPLIIRCENGTLESAYFKALNILSPDFTLNPSMSAVRYIYNNFVNPKNITGLDFLVISELFEELASIKELSLLPNQSWKLKLSSLLADKEAKAFLVSALNDVDIKISDIILKRSHYGGVDVLFERTIHGEKYLIDLNDESDGTQKIFYLLFSFALSRNQARIYVADDLDACLHPKLISAIIDFMNQPENTLSQLIFNSHDIINMNSDVFRRDEIWFAYRDDNYATQLVPLSNIVDYRGRPIRNDAVFSKQYLEGKYGADPFVKKGLSWNAQ
jgi:AAA15 family ATPase/GTPase